jgi:hypothetical protein
MRSVQNWLIEGSSYLQGLKDPSEVNEDNLSIVRWVAGRHFKNKKRDV